MFDPKLNLTYLVLLSVKYRKSVVMTSRKFEFVDLDRRYRRSNLAHGRGMAGSNRLIITSSVSSR